MVGLGSVLLPSPGYAEFRASQTHQQLGLTVCQAKARWV